ncbi:RNHCP domain-containing protein [Deinococcus budaensis]|uniref:DNA-directed RNA polymerase subunit RPC12/RpoP n=1 Tax=Deinococcus budaensis TaxID=1665626 RepID=A0A7W8LNY3_9DEIO|nr:RNHCP domain-containing protein [Deinococcus budaensis]MBB5233208.1 DNA-directed RNA polymerase subunit RPC12/RpoP [Deinococcus budaensis]
MSARRFTVQGTNNAFVCAHCGAQVQPLRNGSVRNHCPACLHSRHVDVQPGDRASDCGGVMAPVGLEQSGKKGWVIVHRCLKCGFAGRNRAALDDPAQPDSWDVMVALSRRPPV